MRFSFSNSPLSTFFTIQLTFILDTKNTSKTKKVSKLNYLSTYHSIYCHVEKSSWPYNIEKSVNVLKNCNHHFILIFWCWSKMTSKQCNIIQYSSVTCDISDKNGYVLVFRMSTGMDDSIHIQIQIIKLHIIWIRFTGINRNLYTIAFFWL